MWRNEEGEAMSPTDKELKDLREKLERLIEKDPDRAEAIIEKYIKEAEKDIERDPKEKLKK
jgi:F0F1-type ATP synthase membrane subunit b/b'